MKMTIALGVCLLALLAAAASASALQMSWEGPLGMYGAGAGASPMLTTMMSGGGLLCPCAEFLRQPQCSPVAAPYYIRREQTMWQPSSICQPIRQQCCQQLRLMDPQSRCQAMCGVAQSVVQQLQMMMSMMQLQGAASSGMLYDPAAMSMMQQQQQLLLPPAAQAPTSMAMVVAQVAQNLPTMCGLYQLPSYCTTPCAVSAVIPPYY